MTEEHDNDALLEAHFRAARDFPAEPGADLLARVMADAEATQERLSRQAPVEVPARSGRLAEMFRALGGWPAVAGLSTATLAGIWIGVAAPDGLATTAVALMGAGEAAYVIDLEPGAGFGFGEEAS